MKNRNYHNYAIILAAGVLLNSGCAAFRAKTTDVDVENMGHMKAHYDASDMRNITENVANKMIASPFLANLTEPPIMLTAGIENRTSDYVDTKKLDERLSSLLLNSGKVKFIDADRRDELLKEQGYQAANVTPGQAVDIGKQLGAKYMITGSLTEMKRTSPRQVRVSKKEMIYYSFAVKCTDLTTGLIEWATEEEFVRESSKPIIGW